MIDTPEDVENPRKRVKVDSDDPSNGTVSSTPNPGQRNTGVDAQTVKETEVGITEFASSDSKGFSGILKKRYFIYVVCIYLYMLS